MRATKTTTTRGADDEDTELASFVAGDDDEIELDDDNGSDLNSMIATSDGVSARSAWRCIDVP
jgi:hypothetical protein